MSSSDSDDDCYGNVAKKLQSLKNKFVPEKSLIFSETSKFIEPPKNEDTSANVLEDENTTLNSTDNEELTLDVIIARNSKGKRGRKRTSAGDSSETTSERVTRSSGRKTANSRRGKGSKTTATTENVEPPIAPPAENVSEPTRGRGRGRRGSASNTAANSSPRGRGRGNTPSRGSGRNRNTPRNHDLLAAYPIFSIGNTDEYPDMCDDQELFSTNTNEVEIIEDIDPLDTDNEELSVKVYWQNVEVVRFNLRKYQKLTPIFSYFSEKENVGYDKLLFMYNDRILTANDTPDSISYSIAKFIDGGIVNQDVSELVKHNNVDNNGLKIKFQCQNLKKPFEITIKAEERLISAMMKCAEHIETPLERLKFYFDGDLLSSKSTPQELDLEGGECIDVKIHS